MPLPLVSSFFLGLVSICNMPCAKPIPVKTGRSIEKDASGRIYNPSGAHLVFVPCGKCDFCKKQKLDSIVQRLNFEYLSCYQTLFVTFTYDDENVHKDLCKDDAKKLLSSLKNALNRHYGVWEGKKLLKSFKFKYFFVGEYGEKRGRIHWHMLLFLDRSIDWHVIQSCNPFGYICDIQVAGTGSLYYCAVYCVKSLVSDNNEQYKGKAAPFYFQSNGVGAGMLKSRLAHQLKIANTYYYRDAKGFSHVLPKYLRYKLFDYFERQEIAQNIADESAKLIPHSVADRNNRIDNKAKKLKHQINNINKTYQSSLL